MTTASQQSVDVNLYENYNAEMEACVLTKNQPEAENYNAEMEACVLTKDQP